MTEKPNTIKSSQAPQGKMPAESDEVREAIHGSAIGARMLLEDSPVCTKIIGLDAKLIFMSRAGITRLQIPDINALYGETYPAELYPEWIRRPMVEHLNRALNGEMSNVECPLLDVNGKEVWYHTTFIPVRGDDGEIQYILATSVDITKRIEAEESLSRIQKLDSIGVLAGGIAHDFNNILTGLTVNLSMAQQEQGLSPALEDLLRASLDVCESARGLTTQLLTFAKGGEPVMETALLIPIVESACVFASRGSNIRCVYDFDPDLFPVLVDKAQLAQVTQNLVINALQAMPEGGDVHISASNVELDVNAHQALPSGKYVKLCVRDEGIGISPDHVSRIFDPYFTTKESGRGLGLASTHSIIIKHGGYVEVDSVLGEGTTFSVYLRAGESDDLKGGVKAEGVKTGGGNVLFMDDDHGVSTAFSRLAISLGYECECASDGEAALERYAAAIEQGNPFDIVVMDLIIPGGMGGKEANQILKARYPDSKSIVCSGYSTDPVMSRHVDFGFDGVLPKPFTRNDLAAVLIEVLEPAN